MVRSTATAVIVDGDATYRQEMADYLSGYGMDVVAQLGEVEGLPALLGRGAAPQLVILNVEPHGVNMLRKVAHLPRQHPNITFFLLREECRIHPAHGSDAGRHSRGDPPADQ